MASIHDSSWETLPSYSELYHGVYNFCTVYIIDHRKEIGLFHNIDSVVKHHRLDITEVVLVLLLAAVWTVLRHFASKYIFKPMGAYFGLTPSNQEKMPESAWKLTYYLLAWCTTLYVVWTNGYFQRPSTVWDGWSLDSSVLPGVYSIYVLQSSYYLHALYATVFQDTWRKDSLVLQAHHLLTLGLLGFSHAFRYNKIGVLVLLFHDVSDIQLEFTKLNVYFKVQRNKVVMLHEHISNLGCVCFMLTWFFARLYWFPLKALHAAAITTLERFHPEQLPFLFYINCLLWFPLAMNVYWFVLILIFAFRVATGQIQEVDDTREYDVEEKIQRNLKLSKSSKDGDESTNQQNGDIHRNDNCQHGSVNSEGLTHRSSTKQRNSGDC